MDREERMLKRQRLNTLLSGLAFGFDQLLCMMSTEKHRRGIVYRCIKPGSQDYLTHANSSDSNGYLTGSYTDSRGKTYDFTIKARK